MKNMENTMLQTLFNAKFSVEGKRKKKFNKLKQGLGGKQISQGFAIKNM